MSEATTIPTLASATSEVWFPQITNVQELYQFLCVLDATKFPIVGSEGNKINLTVDYTNQRIVLSEQTP
jgi:hypothetical protein